MSLACKFGFYYKVTLTCRINQIVSSGSVVPAIYTRFYMIINNTTVNSKKSLKGFLNIVITIKSHGDIIMMSSTSKHIPAVSRLIMWREARRSAKVRNNIHAQNKVKYMHFNSHQRFMGLHVDVLITRIISSL